MCLYEIVCYAPTTTQSLFSYLNFNKGGQVSVSLFSFLKKIVCWEYMCVTGHI